MDFTRSVDIMLQLESGSLMPLPQPQVMEQIIDALSNR